MSFLGWLAFSGGLLLLMGLSSAYLRRLPISASLIYLGLGLALSPLGFGLLALDVRRTPWLEHLTEVAVIVSLYVGGLRLRLPPRDPAWRAAYWLAGPVMLASIAGVAAVVHVGLGLGVGGSVLIGAMLAPTDPVLASSVAVAHAGDHDRMRYGLSGEAGLNDGMAFPFVVFGLAWIEHDGAGAWIGPWAAQRLVWAVPAGLAVGYLLGGGVGRLAIALRSRQRDADAPSDFLALAVIALAYVAAETISAWGFLAVFGAGLGMRGAELTVVGRSPHPEVDADADRHPPAEELVRARAQPHELEQPAVAAGVLVAETLSFGDTVERLLEVLLVLLVGIGLATHFDPRAIGIALVLVLVVRPLATGLLLAASPADGLQRGVMGWFGVRGIGSLYYLGFALREGLAPALADQACAIVFTVVAASIVLHGVTTQPLLGWYERALERRRAATPALAA